MYRVYITYLLWLQQYRIPYILMAYTRSVVRVGMYDTRYLLLVSTLTLSRKMTHTPVRGTTCRTVKHSVITQGGAQRKWLWVEISQPLHRSTARRLHLPHYQENQPRSSAEGVLSSELLLCTWYAAGVPKRGEYVQQINTRQVRWYQVWYQVSGVPGMITGVLVLHIARRSVTRCLET